MKQPLTGKVRVEARRVANEVYVALKGMAKEIAKWKAARPKIGADEVRERLLQEYTRDDFPWMRHFSKVSGRFLPPKTYPHMGRSKRPGYIPHPTLLNPERADKCRWAALLVQAHLHHQTGVSYSLAELEKLIPPEKPPKPPRAPRAK